MGGGTTAKTLIVENYSLVLTLKTNCEMGFYSNRHTLSLVSAWLHPLTIV